MKHKAILIEDYEFWVKPVLKKLETAHKVIRSQQECLKILKDKIHHLEHYQAETPLEYFTIELNQ